MTEKEALLKSIKDTMGLELNGEFENIGYQEFYYEASKCPRCGKSNIHKSDKYCGRCALEVKIK